MTHTTHPPPAADGRLAGLTRFVLRHRRLVTVTWLLLTLAGAGAAGPATRAFSDQFSVPGREGYETNAAVTRAFGNGGDSPPLVPVVSLPRGTPATSPGVVGGLAEVARRLERAVPGLRVASFASTRDRAFMSADRQRRSCSRIPRRRPAASAATRGRWPPLGARCAASRWPGRRCT